MALRASYLYRKAMQVDSHIDKVVASLGFVAASKKYDEKELFTRKAFSSFLIIALVLYSAFPSLVKANVIIMHPTACLGGWQHVVHASGAPNANSYYNEFNSAVLDKNMQTEIYCGPFTGDGVEGTVPSSVSLGLLWSTVRVTEESSSGDSTVEIISDSFASSTQEILDANASSTVSFSATTTVPSPQEETTEEVSAPDTVPLIEEKTPQQEEAQPAETKETAPSSGETGQSADEPVSFTESILFALFPTAYAQEETSSEISPTETVEETLPETDVSQGEGPVEEEMSKESMVQNDAPKEKEMIPTVPQGLVLGTSTESGTTTEAQNEEIATTTELLNTEPTLTENEEKSGGFLEILYSVDGSTWIRIITVSSSEIRETSYDLSLAETSWEKIGMLQIKIQSITSFDETPVVYLDAVELRVSYEKEKEKAPEDESLPVDGIVEVKGLGPHVVFLREKEGDVETLYLYDLQNKNKERLPIDQSISERFPIGFKGGRMFFLTKDEKTLLAYDFATKEYAKVFIPSFDVSLGERAEIYMEGFLWKIIIGSNNFYFYTDETGEVFSDEDSGFVSVIENNQEEDAVLRKETLEFLNIFKKEEPAEQL